MVYDDFTKISLGAKLGELILKDESISVLLAVKERELSGAKQLLDVVSESAGNAQAHPIELVHDIANQIDILKCQKRKIGSKLSILKSMDITAIMPETTAEGVPVGVRQSAVVMFNFLAEEDDQLNVNEGDLVEFIKGDSEPKEGCVLVKTIKSNEIGILPERCLEKIVSSTAPTPVPASKPSAMDNLTKSSNSIASPNEVSLLDTPIAENLKSIEKSH